MSRLHLMTWILPSFIAFCANRSFSSYRFVTGFKSTHPYRRTINSTQRLHFSKMASCAASSDLTSVTDFVRSVKEAVTAVNSGDAKPSTVPHIVIGNEAGDADSILSAIGLSYVKALQSTTDNKLFVPAWFFSDCIRNKNDRS